MLEKYVEGRKDEVRVLLFLGFMLDSCRVERLPQVEKEK
jgi:hypothetical protein